MPDRILAGLSLRQLVILAADGFVIWLMFVAIGRAMHPAVFAAATLPFAAAGAVLVARTPEGLGFDRLAVLAFRFLARPNRRVLAPDGLLSKVRSGTRVAPIEVPLHGVVADDDLIDLGRRGFASICRLSGVNLSLRSDAEQASLIETFARFLNSLEDPTQFLVVSRRVDLLALMSDMSARASSLIHPALQEAARQHVQYLERLVLRRDVRRRELLLCFRDSSASLEDASAHLRRSTDQAQNLLRGLGVSCRRLNAEEAGRYLRACGDSEGPQPPTSADLSSSVITGVVK